MIAEMPALPNKNKPVPMMQECIWDKNPEATFNLDGKILTKPSGSKKSAKRKSKTD